MWHGKNDKICWGCWKLSVCNNKVWIHVIFWFGDLDMLFKLKKPQTGQQRIYLENDTAHLYSQWQSCLKWSLCLNHLLCSPVPEPEVARYINHLESFHSLFDSVYPFDFPHYKFGFLIEFKEFKVPLYGFLKITFHAVNEASCKVWNLKVHRV